MVRAIRAEYIDEHEVVRARLQELVRFCRDTRFALTPEMAVGVFFTVTWPVKKIRDDKRISLAHPVTAEFRAEMEQVILDAYYQMVGAQNNDATAEAEEGESKTLYEDDAEEE